jgi:hypothetical protein
MLQLLAGCCACCCQPPAAACRSSCEALQRYNLINQEGSKAGGKEVWRCRQAVEELRGQVNSKLDKVQASRTAR